MQLEFFLPPSRRRPSLIPFPIFGKWMGAAAGQKNVWGGEWDVWPFAPPSPPVSPVPLAAMYIGTLMQQHA